ncbi:hypothetical protein ES332_D11G313000v1 [Gossypium tomentosum]|uniref:Uncharacterized protein n=1 Tax=Gossypium tomentosum TaxID=34277 RepID=A0A5D2IUL8_GOSTO|nr:hypothetical protein ES332_D11G313000v1 [Gossypium tomentosum]
MFGRKNPSSANTVGLLTEERSTSLCEDKVTERQFEAFNTLPLVFKPVGSLNGHQHFKINLKEKNNIFGNVWSLGHCLTNLDGENEDSNEERA